MLSNIFIFATLGGFRGDVPAALADRITQEEHAKMNENQLENPVLGYVVITVALVVGMLSATVLGQAPDRTGLARPASVPTAVTKPTLPEMATVGDAEPTRIDAFELVAGDDAPRCWILGVRSTPTSAGCVVTHVVQGSAAADAELKIGDRIIAVNGRQVGWVGQKRVPLHQTVDSSKSRHALILVQRADSKTIQASSVRLQTLFESMGN